jgi:hypothetical protein
MPQQQQQQQQQPATGPHALDSAPLFAIILAAVHVLALVLPLPRITDLVSSSPFTARPISRPDHPNFSTPSSAGVLDLQAGLPEAADPDQDALTAIASHHLALASLFIGKVLSYDSDHPLLVFWLPFSA